MHAAYLIDLVHPRVELLVILAGEVIAALTRVQFKAIRAQFFARYRIDLAEKDQCIGLCRRL